MARKKRKLDYDNLTQSEVKRTVRRLRGELAKKFDEDGPKPEWAAHFETLPPEAQQQILASVRDFVRQVCPNAHLPGDPLPPLRPDDGPGLVAAADEWLAGDGAL